MTPQHGGYSVRTSGLRTRASYAEGDADTLWWEKRLLLEVFMTEGNPLGDDQYGAELEKKLPKLQGEIMDAFTACINEAEGIRDGLHGNARTYDSAEPGYGDGQGWSGESGSVPPPPTLGQPDQSPSGSYPAEQYPSEFYPPMP
ncbi:hypothetical protein ACFXJ8_33985 [Nonomuraea sp. NPDC059194]|uniref:hypothetical protein n=1 Tax=Nonomuraea sp. NPDC059194 TaxID=3346764 RepID=UPI0036B5143B